jgi:enoyl-CoA hydratase
MVTTNDDNPRARPLEISGSRGVLHLQLNDPGRGNALSSEMVDRLLEAISGLDEAGAVHTVVFHGSGKHFCTGFDLADLESETDESLAMRFIRLEMLLGAIWHAPVRTVAVAHGRTWGAGADIFVACDTRLCTSDATFRFPGPAFGVVLGTRRLLSRVGRDAARGLTVDGEVWNVERALAAGLGSEVVEAADLQSVLARLALPVADADTAATLRQITSPDHRDSDLAALVRSVSGGQTKARITAYRTAQLEAAKKN